MSEQPSGQQLFDTLRFTIWVLFQQSRTQRIVKAEEKARALANWLLAWITNVRPVARRTEFCSLPEAIDLGADARSLKEPFVEEALIPSEH